MRKATFKNRIGEIKIMKCGEECEIVEYNDCKNIVVKFLKTGELVNCQYGEFKNKSIKSHFTPTVYGVGVIGLENTRDKNGEMISSYISWNGVLERCYSESYQNKHPTYKNCTICEEWIYYKNFKKWYEKNYYEIEGQRMCLDKDILVKGNKIYSPQTCVFVPQDINKLFTKNNEIRGEYPIGVNWKEANQKYQANCSVFDIKANKYKYKYLGLYNTPQEAFQAYKKAKEENVKLVADYYKDRIPEKLYKAMYKYEVHIDD